MWTPSLHLRVKNFSELNFSDLCQLPVHQGSRSEQKAASNICSPVWKLPSGVGGKGLAAHSPRTRRRAQVHINKTLPVHECSETWNVLCYWVTCPSNCFDPKCLPAQVSLFLPEFGMETPCWSRKPQLIAYWLMSTLCIIICSPGLWSLWLFKPFSTMYNPISSPFHNMNNNKITISLLLEIHSRGPL